MNTTNHKDLFTIEELQEMGERASAEAIARLKAKGIPITQFIDGEIRRMHPDGTYDILPRLLKTQTETITK